MVEKRSCYAKIVAVGSSGIDPGDWISKVHQTRIITHFQETDTGESHSEIEAIKDSGRNAQLVKLLFEIFTGRRLSVVFIARQHCVNKQK